MLKLVFHTNMLLSDLIVQTTARLGTNVTTLYTEAIKTNALNTTRLRLILDYNLEEFIKVDTVAVVSGVGTFPSDYLRLVKENNAKNQEVSLWLSDNYYTRVSTTKFYDNVDYTWTIKQDTAGGSFEVYPSTTATFNLRYFYKPDDMSGSDDSGLPSQFDEIHPLMAARQLLFDNAQYDRAAALDEEIIILSSGFNKGLKDYGSRKLSSFQSALSDDPLIL